MSEPNIARLLETGSFTRPKEIAKREIRRKGRIRGRRKEEKEYEKEEKVEKQRGGSKNNIKKRRD